MKLLSEFYGDFVNLKVEVKIIDENNLLNLGLFFCLVIFNFIVDVVEKVVFVVVYIEIMGWYVGFGFMSYVGFISLGLGFIVIEDGMVLINVYVVENVVNVNVKLRDGRFFSGIVVDIDLENDLVVVKLVLRKVSFGVKFDKKIKLMGIN